jgi:hypothetical protein
MSNYEAINLIGVEIEGRWDSIPERAIPESKAPFDPDREERDRQNLMYDGSVVFDGQQGRGNLNNPIDRAGPLIGEAISEPMRPRPAVDWLRQVYPDEVNETCGLHVHFSFPHPYFQWLMDEEFWEYFLEEAEKWGENNPVPDRYFTRLNGNHYTEAGDDRNGTCQRRWHPDEQMHGGHDTRYSHWNFHAFRSHGTVECRVPPAFDDADLACDFVLFLCDMVCSYIESHNPQPFEFSAEPKQFEPTTETI